MFRRNTLRTAAAVAALFCLLWAQLAVAAYACPARMHAAAGTMDTHVAQGDAGIDDDAPCSEHDSARPGLCLAHCNPIDLSLAHAQPDTPPPVLVSLHPAPIAPAIAAPRPSAHAPASIQGGHSPPLAVLYCCYRI